MSDPYKDELGRREAKRMAFRVGIERARPSRNLGAVRILLLILLLTAGKLEKDDQTGYMNAIPPSGSSRHCTLESQGVGGRRSDVHWSLRVRAGWSSAPRRPRSRARGHASMSRTNGTTLRP